MSLQALEPNAIIRNRDTGERLDFLGVVANEAGKKAFRRQNGDVVLLKDAELTGYTYRVATS